MKDSLFLWVISLAIASTILTQSAQARVAVGDPAPPFDPGKWSQGEPVQKLELGHTYIVEFWATWCGPCRASIPHLNSLWQKYKNKGVIVIGQDVWDTDEAVGPFVKKMGTNMTYRVAMDDKSNDHDGFMATHWWKRGVERHGIPAAFVIKDQRVAWIGHPMRLNEEVLDGILSEHFDFTKAAADYRKNREMEQKCSDLQDKLFKDVDNEQWDAASASITELITSFPKLDNFLTMVSFRTLLGQKKYSEAYAFAQSFSDKHPDDALRQNDLAWVIVTQNGIADRNLGLAEKLSERANQATHFTNATILDTMARVQFMSGKKEMANATEQKAIQMAAADEQKEKYKKILTEYQAGHLPDAKP